MTTSPQSAAQQQTDGRTVRDIVEYNQELVSESWCRRIIRQLLQSLEVQYGMHMPHRPITPDSVLVLDAGDPMLLAGVVAPLDPLPNDIAARDIHDLAALVHYAITLELAPATPLRERALSDYSDAFLGAIDRCLFGAPDERPQTIDALRGLLGIVVLGPPSPAALPPELQDMPVPARRSAPDSSAPPPPPPASQARGAAGQQAAAPADMLAHLQRWMMIGGAALVLLVALAALLWLLRQTDASDALTLSLPERQQSGLVQPGAAPLVTLPAAAPAVLEGPVIDETPAGEPLPAQAATRAPEAPDSTVHPTAVQLAPQGTPRSAAIAGTTYRLAIRPWGTIVVDGVERGVSPPLRHITLPPGQHTLTIVNPSFPEHTVTVQSSEGGRSTIELDFTEEANP